MYIFTNIYIFYVYDILVLYILLINNFIDQIIFYWSTLINYLSKHIDLLIKHLFNLIDKLNCQLIGCRVISRAL